MWESILGIFRKEGGAVDEQGFNAYEQQFRNYINAVDTRGMSAAELMRIRQEYEDNIRRINVAGNMFSSSSSTVGIGGAGGAASYATKTNEKLTGFTVEEIDNGYILLAPGTKMYCSNGEELAAAVVTFLVKKKMEV